MQDTEIMMLLISISHRFKHRMTTKNSQLLQIGKSQAQWKTSQLGTVKNTQITKQGKVSKAVRQ